MAVAGMKPSRRTGAALVLVQIMACAILFGGCASAPVEEGAPSDVAFESDAVDEQAASAEDQAQRAGQDEDRRAEEAAARVAEAEEARKAAIDAAYAELDISQDVRSSFIHGDKPAEFQKYIMLHDTEGTSSASSVIDWWDSNGAGVAAHFIVNTDGSIVQAVPLDKITHHAGYGNAGHNDEFGVIEDGRDDMVGTTPIGSWAPDYGMNGSSIGIELVHVGGSGDYPQAQLDALDALIAYMDAYYGFESPITDHKAWRTGNSDTSPEFAPYLENYQATRTHAGTR